MRRTEGTAPKGPDVTIDVTWLGHSTVVLDVDGTRLLTDPLLRRHAGLLRRRGEPPAPAVWQNVDGVLLSHLHHDHADLRSLELLPEGTPVVTAAPNIGWLRRHRLAASAPSRGQWVRVGDRLNADSAAAGLRRQQERSISCAAHVITLAAMALHSLLSSPRSSR